MGCPAGPWGGVVSQDRSFRRLHFGWPLPTTILRPLLQSNLMPIIPRSRAAQLSEIPGPDQRHGPANCSLVFFFFFFCSSSSLHCFSLAVCHVRVRGPLTTLCACTSALCTDYLTMYEYVVTWKLLLPPPSTSRCRERAPGASHSTNHEVAGQLA